MPHVDQLIELAKQKQSFFFGELTNIDGFLSFTHPSLNANVLFGR
jgi:hypothetical protein